MFFEFRQNNTGGRFTIDEDRGLSILVIVEADDYVEANQRAERIGIYFDGVRTDSDCPCCGDRWYEQWSTDRGEPVPSEYGKPLIDVAPDPKWPLVNSGYAKEKPEAYVHLKDGRFFGFHKVEGRYVYRGDPSDLPEALPAKTVKEIES